MSLATRCTSCGTVFRVVQDQLKVSEGWVRCGRCDAVFNALEGLFDLGRDAPPDWDGDPALAAGKAPGGEPADIDVAADGDGDGDVDRRRIAPDPHPHPPPADAGPGASVPASDDRGLSSSFPSTAPAAFQDLLADPIDAHLFRKRGPVVEAKVDERDRLEFSDARFDSDLFAENSAGDEVDPERGAERRAPSCRSRAPMGSPTSCAAPSARLAGTAVRRALALIGLAAIAALVLLLQVGHHFRDTAAARWPAVRPILAGWCGVADCNLEAPRRIDEVTVDSTALTRAIGLDAFVLSVTLKSRSALPLAMPSVDLTLTDGNGRLVARRALAPRDFGAASVIQPGAEAALQVMLNAGSARVTGYTVEIFYP